MVVLNTAGEFLEEIFRRIGKVIHFQGMNQQKWLRLAVIVLIYIIIRPWLMKLGAKVTDQEYTKMEARDKERMDKDKAEAAAEAAVNNLRGGKPSTNENGSTTATQAEEEASETLIERARHRARAAAEAQAMAEEEKRIAMLENWDDDEEFLKNFAKSSDRSHAKRV